MASIIDRASCSYNAQLGANLLLHHIGDACDMVKAVDSPAARLIFDTGHVQAMVEQRGREAQPRRGAARREAGIASRLLRNASQQYRARALSSAPASGDTMAAVGWGRAHVEHMGRTNTSSSRGPTRRLHDPSCVTSPPTAGAEILIAVCFVST